MKPCYFDTFHPQDEDDTFDLALRRTGAAARTDLSTRAAPGLVMVPFRNGHFYPDNVNATCNFQSGGIFENGDGSFSGVYVSVPPLDNPVTTGKGARVLVPFYGRKFGLRFKRPVSFTFDVVIDGVAYEVDGRLATPANAGLWSGSQVDGAALVLVADDLADRLHYAEIVVIAEPNGGATRTVTLLGFLAERRAGYPDPARPAAIVRQVAVGNTQATWNSGFGASCYPRTLERVIYCNTSASAVTVTVQYGGTTVWQEVLAAAGTAGCAKTFDAGGSSYTDLWTHAASTAAVVQATVLGKY